jgi:hypothetical protein
MNSALRRAVYPTRLALGAVLLWPALVAAGASWETDPYELGSGLYFPQQELRIGGYADLHYYGLDHEDKSFSVEDMSLFLTKDIGARWRLFSETEISEALTFNGNGATTKNAEAEVERLYADYFASTAATFRIGRFLTPVGQWNLIHADPLVWTISRPLSTAAAFARSSNGAMLYGTRVVAKDDLDYTLYVDDTRALGVGKDDDYAYGSFGTAGEATPLKNAFEHAVGGQLHYHILDDRLTVGTSFASYQLENPRQQYRLAGLDFEWRAPLVEFSGESVYRTADRPQISSEYGGFLQAVVPLPDKFYLVGRFEHFRNAMPNETDNIRTIAINYRPVPGLVVKLERDDGTHKFSVTPSGWFASFAVLF